MAKMQVCTYYIYLLHKEFLGLCYLYPYLATGELAPFYCNGHNLAGKSNYFIAHNIARLLHLDNTFHLSIADWQKAQGPGELVSG